MTARDGVIAVVRGVFYALLTVALLYSFGFWGCTPPPPETYTDADGRCRYASTGDECPEPTATTVHELRVGHPDQPLATGPCFTLADWRWQHPADWTADATLVDLTASAMDTWEAEIRRDVFGEPVATSNNSVRFAALPEGLAAVAVVNHESRRRNRANGWQVILNDFYPWATDGRPDALDLPSALAHELGHVAGLAHTDCTAETMYGSIDFGETNKRTLEAGDISGIQTLY